MKKDKPKATVVKSTGCNNVQLPAGGFKCAGPNMTADEYFWRVIMKGKRNGH